MLTSTKYRYMAGAKLRCLYTTMSLNLITPMRQVLLRPLFLQVRKQGSGRLNNLSRTRAENDGTRTQAYEPAIWPSPPSRPLPASQGLKRGRGEGLSRTQTSPLTKHTIRHSFCSALWYHYLTNVSCHESSVS